MLPSAALRSPAARSTAASIVVVVVLPLVAVIPSHAGASGPRSRQASSGSLYTSRPASRAAATSGWCGGYHGDTTTSDTRASRSGGGTSAMTTATPAAASVAVRPDAFGSSTVTVAPVASSARAAADPATPEPATRTCFTPSPGGSRRTTAPT